MGAKLARTQLGAPVGVILGIKPRELTLHTQLVYINSEHNHRKVNAYMGSVTVKQCRRISFIIIATLMVFFQVTLVSVGAQEAQPVQETTSAETEPPPKYEFNPETGRWENGTYAWDPTTHKTTPLKEVAYSYNPDTEKWDTTEWKSSKTGEYQPNTVTTKQQPVANKTVSPDSTEEAETPYTYQESGTPTEKASQSLEQAPATITSEDKNSTFYNGYYDVTISGDITSDSRSGDALVSGNTYAGDATSGNAYTYASLLNMVQSTFGMPTLYSTHIQGNYEGDLLIDPGELAVSNVSGSQDTQLTVTQAEDVAIINDVHLTAESGSATVDSNTEAGNATSGDAHAVATIMNLISSSIAAQESFIGILNVMGNLEGDVLLASDITDTLLASNVPTTDVELSNRGDTSVLSDQNMAIDNTIQLTAQSGDAVVSGNTMAGSAASGSANTHVTVFNLTGKQIMTENALLVFVNVGGEWVGFITNAPSGATAAMLGSGESSITTSKASDYEVRGNYDIVNNVYASAKTGDATVSNNSIGGDATSGDAHASASIFNMVNSTVSLGSWFGALFINVFGDWHGSFGVDTAYGGYSTHEDGNYPSGAGGIGGDMPQTTSKTAVSRPIVFVASEDGTFRSVNPALALGDSAGGSPRYEGSRVAASTKVAPAVNEETSPAQSNEATRSDTEPNLSWLFIAASVGGAGVLSRKQYTDAKRSRTTNS